MYTQFFQFTTQPFSIAPDPRFIYASQQHQEGLAHLLYGIQMGGGFVALTGEVGTGKTLLCHCLLQQLPANVDMALILNPRLDAVDLLASICDELGIATTAFTHSLKNLVDALNKHLLATHAQGRRTVLMIDEAQNLNLDVLEQIRLLTNLETTTDKLLQIILVGQPELRDLLNRPALRQLNQRITAHYHLHGLDLDETRTYIQHRLNVCRGDPQLFKPAALRKIFKLSGGIPRLINRLCDRALLGAYAKAQRQVDVKLVLNAAKEANLLNSLKPNNTRPQWMARLLGVVTLCCLLWGGWLYFRSQVVPVIKPSLVTSVGLPLSPAIIDPLAVLNAQQQVTLSDALGRALKMFSKTKPAQQPLDCKAIEALGLACFLDKSSWKEMLNLKRPVVLELEMAPNQKQFGLLTGVSGTDAVLAMDKEVYIPITTLMQHWNGYYLLVWQPPVAGLKELAPGQTHAAVIGLRQQLNVPAKAPMKIDFFDPVLMQAVIAFQKQQQLMADGLVGARTFVHLQNKQPMRQTRLLTVKD